VPAEIEINRSRIAGERLLQALLQSLRAMTGGAVEIDVFREVKEQGVWAGRVTVVASGTSLKAPRTQACVRSRGEADADGERRLSDKAIIYSIRSLVD
jgi:hypothetical protein